MQMKIGSFFVLRNFQSRLFTLRRWQDPLLIFIRVVLVCIFALIIIDPADIQLPPGNIVVMPPDIQLKSSPLARSNVPALELPSNTLDAYNEDIFFLKAFQKNLNLIKHNLTIYYHPDWVKLQHLSGYNVIIPGMNQSPETFDKWSDRFEWGKMVQQTLLIQGNDCKINSFFETQLRAPNSVSVYASLENQMPIAIAFEDNDAKILVFTTGPSTIWGEAGLCGFMMDMITRFQYDNNFGTTSTSSTTSHQQDDNLGQLSSIVPQQILIYIAMFLIAIEAIIVFINIRQKKRIPAAILVILMLWLGLSTTTHAFQFIDISPDASTSMNTYTMFGQLKQAIEQRTSVKIDTDFYATITPEQLKQGKRPSLPYLWILGCNEAFFLEESIQTTLSDFVQRGGMIFFNTCGNQEDWDYFIQIQRFVEHISLNTNQEKLHILDQNHPIYKSFYLIDQQLFYGMDVSQSTKRTAIIVSRQNLPSLWLEYNENAIRVGINIVLYMLSGNYKSDQIHVREILKKIKKREYYK
ncbi:MAG: DUF4159 domain-containing protein [Desulfobacterales bacterium]|nr:DUF4159 domain-containing protein [Desulfobacterales bacterium]